MSVLDDNFEEQGFDFNVPWEICEALRKTLKHKRNGNHFSTGVIPCSVGNEFIEEILSNDLRNYCLVVEDIVEFTVHGCETGPHFVYKHPIHEIY